MLLAVSLFTLSAAFQGGTPPRPQQTIVRDSTRASDSAKVRGQYANPRWAPRRLPVTAEVLASAFRDSETRELFNRARKARITQDSSLNSYDAKVRQRMSVQVGIGKFGRDRLVYRQESASRVQWQRTSGVHVEMTGARVAIPMIAGTKEERDALQSNVTDEEFSPIPYVPGSETLWIGDLSARTEVSERDLVNPIAGGAEAYYTYQLGDSLSFRLPDGQTIRLRELKVRPRAAKPNLVVGTLLLDASSGQLVRAAYRLAVPVTATFSVEGDSGKKPSKTAQAIVFTMRSLVSPMTAQLSGVVVEYGLFQGRYWLPRSQSVEGLATVMFARVPIKLENSYTYASVNAQLGLAAVNVDTTIRYSVRRPPPPPPGLDSAARKRWQDSTQKVYVAALKARADSVKVGMRVGSMRQCDSSATRVITRYRSQAQVPVELRVPCDLTVLTSSTDLPKSVYDEGEELFGSTESEQLLKTLSMTAQAPFSLLTMPPPRVQIGPSMTRYNRVEGFSTGVLLEQQLGGGYVTTGVFRYGFADRMPNAELSIGRTNLSKTITLNGYRRLVSVSDWGNPLSFGASFGALLFGRDEGFYYRATGGELRWTTERGARLDWRAFAERQTAATQRTNYSLAGNFLPNLEASSGTSAGAAVRFVHDYGVATRGFRAFTDLRLEAAGGDSTYGRAALDLTLSSRLIGKVDGALTLSGGTTAGHVPPQRRWFLGGTETIRGQRPDTTYSGNAYWMARAELARVHTGFRTSLFGDIGWVGDRDRLGEVGRPLSGVGIGWSMFDGLLRFDIARGLYPREQTRLALYLGARF
jgi:hypothetical protein